MPITASESQYASKITSTSGFKPASTSSVSDTQNLLPMGDFTQYEAGSEQWVQARLAAAYQKLKAQYEAIAAQRGLSHSGITEDDLAKAMAQERMAIESEAAEIRLRQSETAKQREHESKMASEAAKSQEKASMYSGLGQLGAYGLMGRYGTEKGAESGFSKLTKGLSERPALPSSAAPAPAQTAPGYKGLDLDPMARMPGSVAPRAGAAPAPSKWDTMKAGLSKNVLPIAGGAVLGTALAGGGAGTKSGMLGGAYGGLASSLMAPGQSGWSALASSAIPAYVFGKMRGNILSKKNIAKTVGGAALPFLLGAFGR